MIVCAGAPSAIAQASESVESGTNTFSSATTDIGSTTTIPMNDLYWHTEMTCTKSYYGGTGDCRTAMDPTGARTIPIARIIAHHSAWTAASKGLGLVADGQKSMQGNS